MDARRGGGGTKGREERGERREREALHSITSTSTSTSTSTKDEPTLYALRSTLCPRPEQVGSTTPRRYTICMADLSSAYRAAADAVRSAEALVIGAGAGMGVDSGLPDFRGPEGFWKAYPPLAAGHFWERSTPPGSGPIPPSPGASTGTGSTSTAPPPRTRGSPFSALGRTPARDPLRRYRQRGRAVPEGGVRGGRRGTTRLDPSPAVPPGGAGGGSGEAERSTVDVHEATMRARSALPRCPMAGLARPNILMFGDGGWIGRRTDDQEANLETFYQGHAGEPMTVLEIGAGTAVPTIRLFAERLGDTHGATVIRVDPREPRIVAAAGVDCRRGAGGAGEDQRDFCRVRCADRLRDVR